MTNHMTMDDMRNFIDNAYAAGGDDTIVFTKFVQELFDREVGGGRASRDEAVQAVRYFEAVQYVDHYCYHE